MVEEKRNNHLFKFPTLGEQLKDMNMVDIFKSIDFVSIFEDITESKEKQNKILFRFKNFLNDVYKVNVKRERGRTTGMMLIIINKAVECGELINQLEIISSIPTKYHYLFNEIFAAIGAVRIGEKKVVLKSLSVQLLNIVKIKIETLINFNKIISGIAYSNDYTWYYQKVLIDEKDVELSLQSIKDNIIELNDYKITQY